MAASTWHQLAGAVYASRSLHIFGLRPRTFHLHERSAAGSAASRDADEDLCVCPMKTGRRCNGNSPARTFVGATRPPMTAEVLRRTLRAPHRDRGQGVSNHRRLWRPRAARRWRQHSPAARGPIAAHKKPRLCVYTNMVRRRPFVATARSKPPSPSNAAIDDLRRSSGGSFEIRRRNMIPPMTGSIDLGTPRMSISAATGSPVHGPRPKTPLRARGAPKRKRGMGGARCGLAMLECGPPDRSTVPGEIDMADGPIIWRSDDGKWATAPSPARRCRRDLQTRARGSTSSMPIPTSHPTTPAHSQARYGRAGSGGAEAAVCANTWTMQPARRVRLGMPPRG